MQLKQPGTSHEPLTHRSDGGQRRWCSRQHKTRGGGAAHSCPLLSLPRVLPSLWLLQGGRPEGGISRVQQGRRQGQGPGPCPSSESMAASVLWAVTLPLLFLCSGMVMASVTRGSQDVPCVPCVPCGAPWLHGGRETVQVGLVSQEPESRGSPGGGRREVRGQGHEEDDAYVTGCSGGGACDAGHRCPQGAEWPWGTAGDEPGTPVPQLLGTDPRPRAECSMSPGPLVLEKTLGHLHAQNNGTDELSLGEPSVCHKPGQLRSHSLIYLNHERGERKHTRWSWQFLHLAVNESYACPLCAVSPSEGRECSRY